MKLRPAARLLPFFLVCAFSLFGGSADGLAEEPSYGGSNEITETTLNGSWRLEYPDENGDYVLLTFRVFPAEKRCELIIKDLDTGKLHQSPPTWSYHFTGQTFIMMDHYKKANVTFKTKDRITIKESGYNHTFIRVKE